jgi:F-type H+-transporting ATPase subunit b
VSPGASGASLVQANGMDSTFQQLGQLLFRSIPTILIFVALHFYLKWVLYRPLQATLAARAEKIEGKLAAARQTGEQAAKRLAGYEEALRQKRIEGYHRVEARRQEALGLGQKQLADARHQAARAMVEARQHLAAQGEATRAHLQATAETLAGQILGQVLSGRQSASTPGARA